METPTPDTKTGAESPVFYCLNSQLSQLVATGKRLVVGYSGGIDSQVLLVAVVKLFGPENVRAVHINHQLSPLASDWQQFCQHSCEQLGVDFYSEKVEVDPSRGGLEQSARTARYRVFRQQLQGGDVLLLAHHANDQAETLLYRLMRGAGVQGLSAMPGQRSLGDGMLLRPLLDIGRKEIEQFASDYHLQWIEDESNNQLHMDRNYLRHQVMPNLVSRWPHALENINRSVGYLAEAHALNRQLAELDLIACDRQSHWWGESVALDNLLGLDQIRQKNLVRHWVQMEGFSSPPASRLDNVFSELMTAKPDAVAMVEFADCQLRRFDKRLCLVPPLQDSVFDPIEQWDPNQPLILSGVGKLTCITAPEPGSLSVQSRQGGERARPVGRNHSQRLKKLFQEYRIPPWWRDKLPVIYRGDQIIAVANAFVCEPGWEFELSFIGCSKKAHRNSKATG